MTYVVITRKICRYNEKRCRYYEKRCRFNEKRSRYNDIIEWKKYYVCGSNASPYNTELITLNLIHCSVSAFTGPEKGFPYFRYAYVLVSTIHWFKWSVNWTQPWDLVSARGLGSREAMRPDFGPNVKVQMFFFQPPLDRLHLREKERMCSSEHNYSNYQSGKWCHLGAFGQGCFYITDKVWEEKIIV